MLGARGLDPRTWQLILVPIWFDPLIVGWPFTGLRQLVDVRSRVRLRDFDGLRVSLCNGTVRYAVCSLLAPTPSRANNFNKCSWATNISIRNPWGFRTGFVQLLKLSNKNPAKDFCWWDLDISMVSVWVWCLLSSSGVQW